MSFKEFGMGDGDDHVKRKGKRFKGEGGRKYRFSFGWWSKNEDGSPNFDAKSPKFLSADCNFIEKVGFVVNDGPEFTAIAGEPPKPRVGTIIVAWPVDKEGELIREALKRYDVMVWAFGSDKYEAIKPHHREFHFGSNDLCVNCTATQYQKMTFSPARDNILRTLLESEKEPARKLGKKILADVAAMADSVAGEIAQKLSPAKLRERMGGAAESPVPESGIKDDAMDDLVGGILDEDFA